MSDTVLRVENVTMQFGGVVAVDNLSMQVERGQIVALIGPNGAGKTTAFNCITGVYEPTNGAVWFENERMLENHPRGKMRKNYLGQNAGKYSKTLTRTPDRITEIGIARTFQNIRLFSKLSVYENVLIAKHMRAKQNFLSAAFHLNFREENRMRAETDAILESQGLTQYANDISGSLPYGIQRRVEIARALATDPKLLLLDEPAAGMNPQETAELTDLIVRIKNQYNLSVFMIEHHMDLVMRISDRIYVLDFGKLIAEGTAAEVQENPRVIEAYLGVNEEESDAED